MDYWSKLEIEAGRAEEAIAFLHNVAVPMIKQGAGFVSGTWMRSLDGLHARSLILYEDEESASCQRQTEHDRVLRRVHRLDSSLRRCSRSWRRPDRASSRPNCRSAPPRKYANRAERAAQTTGRRMFIAAHAERAYRR